MNRHTATLVLLTLFLVGCEENQPGEPDSVADIPGTDDSSNEPEDISDSQDSESQPPTDNSDNGPQGDKNCVSDSNVAVQPAACIVEPGNETGENKVTGTIAVPMRDCAKIDLTSLSGGIPMTSLDFPLDGNSPAALAVRLPLGGKDEFLLRIWVNADPTGQGTNSSNCDLEDVGIILEVDGKEERYNPTGGKVIVRTFKLVTGQPLFDEGFEYLLEGSYDLRFPIGPVAGTFSVKGMTQ